MFLCIPKGNRVKKHIKKSNPPCRAIDDYPRGLVKRWDEFREDINYLSTHIDSEKEFWLIEHLKNQDRFFAYLYQLTFNESFEKVAIKDSDGNLRHHNVVLRKAFWEI